MRHVLEVDRHADPVEPDSPIGRGRFLAGVTGVSVASLVSGAVVSPVSAQSEYTYEPPEGRSISDLAAIYNQHIGAVPGWFKNAVATSRPSIRSYRRKSLPERPDGPLASAFASSSAAPAPDPMPRPPRVAVGSRTHTDA